MMGALCLRPAVRALSSITNIRDNTGRLALASVALCHSEPQLRYGHSEPPARNLSLSQRRDPSRCSG
jgi:hypothetical protein